MPPKWQYVVDDRTSEPWFARDSELLASIAVKAQAAALAVPPIDNLQGVSSYQAVATITKQLKSIRKNVLPVLRKGEKNLLESSTVDSLLNGVWPLTGVGLNGKIQVGSVRCRWWTLTDWSGGSGTSGGGGADRGRSPTSTCSVLVSRPLGGGTQKSPTTPAAVVVAAESSETPKRSVGEKVVKGVSFSGSSEENRRAVSSSSTTSRDTESLTESTTTTSSTPSSSTSSPATTALVIPLTVLEACYIVLSHQSEPISLIKMTRLVRLCLHDQYQQGPGLMSGSVASILADRRVEKKLMDDIATQLCAKELRLKRDRSAFLELEGRYLLATRKEVVWTNLLVTPEYQKQGMRVLTEVAAVWIPAKAEGNFFELKPSTAGGFGLFLRVNRPLRQGTLVEYHGEKVGGKLNPSFLHSHTVTLKNGLSIHGLNGEGEVLCWAAMANDGSPYNTAQLVEFDALPDRCFIQLLADLPGGTEVLVSYGKRYWDLTTKQVAKQKTIDRKTATRNDIKREQQQQLFVLAAPSSKNSTEEEEENPNNKANPWLDPSDSTMGKYCRQCRRFVTPRLLSLHRHVCDRDTQDVREALWRLELRSKCSLPKNDFTRLPAYSHSTSKSGGAASMGEADDWSKAEEEEAQLRCVSFVSLCETLQGLDSKDNLAMGLTHECEVEEQEEHEAVPVASSRQKRSR